MFIVFLVVPDAMVRFPRVRSFEEETFPAVIEMFPILLVARLRFILPEVMANVPTVNLGPDGVSLAPPPKVIVLLEISLFSSKELLKMFIAILLVKLPVMLIALVVLIVKKPVRNSLPAKSMEVKLEPERTKLGVMLEVIEPVKVKFPAMVRVWLA